MATAVHVHLHRDRRHAMFQRRSSIDWTLTRPVLFSALIFAFVGAWTIRSRARPRSRSTGRRYHFRGDLHADHWHG
jgi:hypothetical protein